MKKIASLILFISLGISYAQADGRFSHTCMTPAAQENNFRNSLWFNSRNRAGLAFKPIEEYNYLDLRYDMRHGKFRPQTVGASSNNVSLNTNGAVMLGKFMIWGDFSFRNIFEKGAYYNTALYEVAEDMPYFIMDAQESNWNKQEYEMAASITSPVISDIISFGLKLQYLTKVGAKQKDPRSETYKYNVEIVPSVVMNLGKHNFMGLYGLFDNNFERSIPSLNNYAMNQEIIYNKGLGEGIKGIVGGNGGVKTLFYKGMKYGGGLQYSYDGKAALLADFGFIARSVDAFENPTLPKRLGSSESADITGDIQLLFGNSKSNKFTLNFLFSGTDGLEYVQKKNEEAFNQKWETIKVNSMSNFKKMHTRLNYDHLFGNDASKGYDWKVGGSALFSYRDYTYSIPKTSFTATSLLLDINGARQFKFRTSTLLLSLDGSYNLNLGGDYNYGGNKNESIQVDYYEKENDFLTSDYLKTGARVAYTLSSEKVNWFIDLKGDWIKPLANVESRLVCTASIGIVF